MKVRGVLWLAAIIFVLSIVGIAKADIAIFGTGFSLPESISLAPTDFGAFGGDYFIPDPGINFIGLGHIDYLPPTGGMGTVFVTLPGGAENPVGGLFLPNNFGSFGGQYLAVGSDANGSFADGRRRHHTVTPVTSLPGNEFVTPVLAPLGFGAVGGNVLVTSSDGTVKAIDQNGNLSTFASVTGAPQLFGSAFAPHGFGSVGGDLLVTDAGSGKIFAVDANGNASLFTTVNLGENQPGLDQDRIRPRGLWHLWRRPVVIDFRQQSGRRNLRRACGFGWERPRGRRIDPWQRNRPLRSPRAALYRQSRSLDQLYGPDLYRNTARLPTYAGTGLSTVIR